MVESARSFPITTFIFFLNCTLALLQDIVTWHQNCSSHFGTAAKSLQLCPTLCDPIDGSPTGSPVPGILQARILEWVAISFSNAWKWKWSHSVVSDSQRPYGLQPTRLLHPLDFPGKSTGVGCHCLLHTLELGVHILFCFCMLNLSQYKIIFFQTFRHFLLDYLFKM